MNIRELNEKLENILESTLYQIYDDEWEDSELLDEQGVIDFAVEHFLDRQEDFTSIQDFKQCVGREDGTDNPYKEDGTYNLCVYEVTEESKILYAICQKIKANQEITFEEAEKLLNVLNFKIKKETLQEGIDTNNKEEENYQNFITELEKISKKYGIGLSACGCFDYWDENGFQDIKYKRDSSSGDLMIQELIYSDGEKLF